MSIDPEIRYCTTRDGVNIAYFAIGHGPAVVVSSLPLSHVRLEWDLPGNRAMFESIARVATWVRFDHRGFGLSERNVSDFSLELLVSDLEAVVDSLGLTRMSLIANAAASPIAIAYAAIHSDIVSRLVLQPGFVRATGRAWSQWQQLAEMASEDWEFASEAMLRTITGWDTATARADAALLRATTDPTTLATYLRYAKEWDAARYVEHVRTPTLLTEVSTASYTTPESSRSLAASLPDGRLVMFTEGTREEQFAQARAATARFLGGDSSIVGARPEPSGAAAAVILFTDIVDSTALTERLGDTRFREASRALDAGLRAAIGDAGGAAIDGKLLGDGVLATFSSAAQAIDGARRCLALSAASELGLHIGLHAGDVIREENNVFGGAVNIAARICALSAPGEILVSDVVRGMARSSASVAFDDRGEQEMKGVGEPVRVYAVRDTP
jgi:class 3 adenylate cyclase